MILSMFLAHLVGDYILQWNSLAYWKSRALAGVSAHCLIVASVTWLFALPFDPLWGGVLVISLLHFAIDATQLKLKPPVPPLTRFAIDQAAHGAVIMLTLAYGGYLDLSGATAVLQQLMHNQRLLLMLTGYAFVTMPAWVVIKFTAYGLVTGAAPEFRTDSKYIEILERLLITTFVVLGQFYLVPLVVAPRLFTRIPHLSGNHETAVYLTELLVSITLAVVVGLLLGSV